MNIAIISNGTFNEEHYKEYFNSCDDTKLCCVCSVDDELPEGHYDVIAVDYYNENLSPDKLNYLSEQHPESVIIILVDIDFENDNFENEEKILKKFKIDFATCYNIKIYDAKSFYDFAKTMIETKNECENGLAPETIRVVLWILAFVAFIILGLIHYLH